MKTSKLFVAVLACALLVALIPNFASVESKQDQLGDNPLNLVVWDSGTYVQLNWDIDPELGTTRYNIHRSEKTANDWMKLNEDTVLASSFVDYSAPRSELLFYRVNRVDGDGRETQVASIIEINTSRKTSQVQEIPDEISTPQYALAYSKNNIISDSELINANAMSTAQIQSFLSSQGSVLANFVAAGKTAAQHIYDNCQTHGISPYVVLVTLQKEKGLIKSTSASPNNYAMGWSTWDASVSSFVDQIYYGTRQFKLYYNNIGNYGWTIGQPKTVSDGTVTPVNIATAGLYSYTPWIGQGGGGQTGIGGNYLFWDLWYNTFGFTESPSSSALMSSGWHWPTGSSNFCGYLGWLGFNSAFGGYHLAQDMCNSAGSPVYSIGDGDAIQSRTDVGGYGPGGGAGGALIARYQASDGTWFTVLYGHLNNPHAVGHISAGEVIGTSNSYNPPHVHFAVHPGFDAEPTNPWRGYTSSTSTTYGFVDPIPFLNAHGPGSSCTNGPATLRNRDGGPPLHPPGSVIKTASSSTVYLIDVDNRRRPITSSGVLAQLYNQSTDARTGTNFTNWVITVGQDELDLYEQGGNLSAALPGNGKPFPDGKLISFNGEVSMVTGGGRRRAFTDGNRFTGLGFNFCQVVTVTQSEYNQYSAGPPVDAMPLLTSSVSLSPSSPYIVGQNITGAFTIKNVGYASISFSNLGLGGRFNGSTVFDLGFVSNTLSAGSSYAFGSPARQLTSAGTYDFFGAYQENNGHWTISVPAAPGVQRSRQIQVSATPTPTPTPTPIPTPSPTPNCFYSLSSYANEVSPGNGSTNFLMDTSSGCAWSAVSDSPSWLTTSSSGSGDGTIRYDHTANSSTSPRTGTITAGGQVHTVTQIGVGGAGTVQFSGATYTVSEGGGTATITITRTGGTASGHVNYSISNGTATAGSDYTAANGLLIFSENVTSRTFDVTIHDDSEFEGNESLNLSITSVSTSLTIGSPNTATLTITDNEASPSPTPTPNPGACNETVWFDDSVPSGATAVGSNDGWNWVGSNPTPFSGSLANQSAIVSGVHDHYFVNATATLPLAAGDVIFTYVYLDPSNLPQEIMLSFNDGNWGYRAYWGSNLMPYGTDGTNSRRYMGPLPAAGQWVRLEVPASQVGLEGHTLTGLSFLQYGGRATWDRVGKCAAPPPPCSDSVWFDDAVPAGAMAIGSNDGWNWVGSNPTPFSGSLAHQSAIVAGVHDHYFINASSTLPLSAGDVIFAYVYLDPSNLPQEIMLSFNDGNWGYRAYWGANLMPYGTDGTNSRRYMGPLPAAGQWVRLAVPASQVGLEGHTLTGLSFLQYGGRATWDRVGKCANSDTVWGEDAVPTGAVPVLSNDGWNWISSNPAPYAGSLAHQSSLITGVHDHYFLNATQTLPINVGDKLIAYVYLDPVNPPQEIMLSWNDGNWGYRAYWGANLMPYGTDGTSSRRYMGPLPPAGQWVRLEVPASQVGLEGHTLTGMSFLLYNGRATWDHAGKSQ